ncbi:MAG: PfkB family carbohydrate kinase [bacterium]|nr:PfkB family carbohydrate kinase [bacterium]
MPYDFITIGGATEDITFYTREGVLIDNKKDLTKQKLLAFEYGAKIKIDKSFSGFGGGAANAAVCLARLGFKTACLAAIGRDDRGQRILNNFKREGVDGALLQEVKNSATGFSFLLVGSDNEHICFSNRAANDELRIMNHEREIMEKAKWIYLTSQSGAWQKNLDKIFSVEGAKIAWNPGHRQIIAGVKALGKYLKKTACLIVNKDEATELILSDKKYAALNLNNQKNLLQPLMSYGPRMALITNGRHGADALVQGKIYHQPIVKEKRRVDTTGVGDAFGSSFVGGLELYGGDIKKALLLAAKNSAAEVSEQGAQNGLLKRGEI